MFTPLADSAHAESGGDLQRQNAPPRCQRIRCAIAPHNDVSTIDPRSGAPLRSVRYQVLTLGGATLQTINEMQDISMFVFERNPTNPNTGICDIPTIANGGCQSPNPIDDAGFYTDDYSAGNSGPNTVTQQFFVDRRLTPVFWPQIVVDSNGFQSTAWFGAKSQDATVNRSDPNGAFIKQNSPDLTNSVTCGAVCFRRQANGSPAP
jgi:hypothetical protein